MANTPSAKKAARKIARRTAVNTARRSRVRTFLRRVEEALQTGDHQAAVNALKVAEPELMRATSKARNARRTVPLSASAPQPPPQTGQPSSHGWR